MKYQPAIFRLVHWTELFKPVAYFVFLILGLSFSPIPLWATLIIALLVGGGTFLRERLKWVRATPQCIEVTASGLTITEKLKTPQSVQWAVVRNVTSDDELGGWKIETADHIVRCGVAGLSREGMSAIETAIHENSRRYNFEVREVQATEQPVTKASA